ncbi:LysR substrate-binding domain-containing protein [Paraburkholderia solisilvae]|uniref:HTH-type transcriptional regulator ArgP n=1 Tax=Paraburkholderia solisilvae TaxID=624376 RepID=A0A6J5E2F8_9BURK|nr:LysR substrate-binding domain-containing protein [Paraburkholderia solisilvae]CAB3760207.1 HTH-type transcriptional regulator ArgP [Paraburkholderia solisilvae]
MELRQLKYFVAIVESGSISNAAQRLFIAQSALSRQIAELEEELGSPLLVRTRTGVRVTESGQIFYDYAKAILKQLADACHAVRTSTDAVTGSVTLGVPQSASVALALPLLQATREKLPGILLHVNEELSGNLLDQLRQGLVDLAIFTANIPVSADLEFSPVLREEFFWIRGTHHAAPSTSDTIRLEDICNYPLVMAAAQHGHCTRAIVEDRFAAEGLPSPPLLAEINSVHVMKSAIQAGLATSILPLALVKDEVDAGTLFAHRIGTTPLQRVLGICLSRELPRTNAKRAVSMVLREVMHSLSASGQWPGTQPAEDTP